MTNHIKRVASGVSALALILGGVFVPGKAWATEVPVCTDSVTESTCKAATESELRDGLGVETVSRINLAGDIALGAILDITRSLTLDLGEYTLSGGNDIYVRTSGAGTEVTIEGGVNGAITEPLNVTTNALQVINGSKVILNSGTISATQYAVRVSEKNATNSAELVINGGKIEATSTTAYTYGIFARKNAVVRVNGGTITSANGFAISGNGSAGFEGAAFYVNGGTLTSANDYAIYFPQIDGVLNIAGGTISGGAGAVAANRGTINIANASLTSLGTAEIAGSTGGDGTQGYNNAVIGISKEYGPVTLNITSGTFTASGNAGMITDVSNLDNANPATVTVSGGSFSIAPEATQIASGKVVYQNDDMYNVVAAEDFALSLAASGSSIAEGETITVTPTVTWGSTDVTSNHTINYTIAKDGGAPEELASGSFTPEVGATGSYVITATETTFNKTDSVEFTVTDRSALDFSDAWTAGEEPNTYTRKVYVAEGMALNVADDLGVTITGTESDITVTGATVSAGKITVSNNATVVWSYKGKTGTLDLNIIPAYAMTMLQDAVRVGDYGVIGTIDGLKPKVEEASVAYAGVSASPYSETMYYVNGIASGTAYVGLAADDNSTVFGGRFRVDIYNLTTTMQSTQLVGTSQTFSFTIEDGWEIAGVYPWSSSDEDEEDPDVEFKDNGDGTYTLTANRIPTYEWCEDDEDESTCETEFYPYTGVAVMVRNKETSKVYENYYGTEIVTSTKEQEREEVFEEIASSMQEAILAGAYTTEVIAENDYGVEGPITRVTFSNGLVADIVISQDNFFEAVENGATVTTTVQTDELDEDDIADLMEDEPEMMAALYNALSGGEKGTRVLDVYVLVRVNGYAYGAVTELNEPVTFAVDVTDDAENDPVATGYKRVYRAVRYHNGVATLLDESAVVYDEEFKKVYVSSDEFSTYMVVYEDVLNTTANTGFSTSEGESATASVALSVVVAIIAITLAGAVKFAKARR